MKKTIIALALTLSSFAHANDFSSMNVRLSILQDARVQAILSDLTKEYFVDEVKLTRTSQVENMHILRVSWGYKMNGGHFCYSIDTNEAGAVTSIGEQRDCR